MTIEKLREKFGSVNYKGVEYILKQDAYYSHDDFDGHYEAAALRNPPIMDDDDEEVNIKVLWDIIDDYDPQETEEADACEWDAPASIHIDCYWLNNQFVPSSDI